MCRHNAIRCTNPIILLASQNLPAPISSPHELLVFRTQHEHTLCCAPLFDVDVPARVRLARLNLNHRSMSREWQHCACAVWTGTQSIVNKQHRLAQAATKRALRRAQTSCPVPFEWWTRALTALPSIHSIRSVQSLNPIPLQNQLQLHSTPKQRSEDQTNE